VGQKVQRLHQSEWIAEGEDCQFPAVTIRDAAGAVIPSTAMSTMLLTLYLNQPPNYPIIGAVEQVDVKNDGARGVITTTGIFTLKLTKADNVLVSSLRGYEIRVALVEWTAGATKAGIVEYEHVVENIPHRPFVAL
jgi:hypothetical protein